MSDNLMEKIVSLCKRRGFIFQNSEIYGGLANTWDYGPLGVELKKNVKDVWWQDIVQNRDDIVGLDSAILMHPKVWEASGHLRSFADPYIKCLACSKFFKLDKIWDDIWNSKWFTSLKEAMIGVKDSSYLLRWAKDNGKNLAPNLSLTKQPEVTVSWLADLHHKFSGVDLDFKNFVGRIACTADGIARMPCPNCGNALPEESMSAQLMLETSLGPVGETAQLVYLRPETAQGIFVNFKNILDTTRMKIPFGIAQIGKAFRNEITPGNFTFRTREFEQMEIEYFVHPNEVEDFFKQWINRRFDWYIKLGIKKENLRLRPHDKNELAHYAKACTDIEYKFPFSTQGGSTSGGGWSELEGIANRGDFDLKEHAKASGKDFSYTDSFTKEKFTPFIIEPSGGVDRSVLAFLVDAYREETVRQDKRVVLGLTQQLAPIKVAVLPLLKKNEKIVEIAKRIASNLRKSFTCVYDDTGAIGKLYRRQDEVGTPYCVTVDVQSLEDKKVTVRDRDSMGQDRISIDRLREYLEKLLNYL